MMISTHPFIRRGRPGIILTGLVITIASLAMEYANFVLQSIKMGFQGIWTKKKQYKTNTIAAIEVIFHRATLNER